MNMDMNDMHIDPYQVLGLDNNCSDSDINRAFRKMSLKYHPDRNHNDPEAEKKFRQVATAKDLLTDQELKAAYDSGGWMLVDLAQQRRQQITDLNRKCPPVIINIMVTLKQIYDGTTLPITHKIPGKKESFSLDLKLESRMIGKTINIPNQGTEMDDHITGDVHIKTNVNWEKEKTIYDIRDFDLIFTASLRLVDLFGYTIKLYHPNGHTYFLHDIVKTFDEKESLYIAPSLGFMRPNGTYGNLLINLEPTADDILKLSQSCRTKIIQLIREDLGVKEINDSDSEGIDLHDKVMTIDEYQAEHSSHTVNMSGDQCCLQ